MLHSSWESYATLLANASSSEALHAALASIVTACNIDTSITATVVYGHDTRPSCPSLVKALEDGLEAMGTKKIAAGLVTTPILHYLVRCYNTSGTKEAYGEPTELGYYEKLAKAYRTLTVSLLNSHITPTSRLTHLILTGGKEPSFSLDRRLRKWSRRTNPTSFRCSRRGSFSTSSYFSRQYHHSWRFELPMWS